MAFLALLRPRFCILHTHAHITRIVFVYVCARMYNISSTSSPYTYIKRTLENCPSPPHPLRGDDPVSWRRWVGGGGRTTPYRARPPPCNSGNPSAAMSPPPYRPFDPVGPSIALVVFDDRLFRVLEHGGQPTNRPPGSTPLTRNVRPSVACTYDNNTCIYIPSRGDGDDDDDDRRRRRRRPAPAHQSRAVLLIPYRPARAL